MNKKVLVIIGHPNLEDSYANSTIVSELRKTSLDLTIRNLIDIYPDYKIDVEEEQKHMSEADIIVLQFPLFWYSVPAILKQWIDSVFTFGFAFGPEGSKLQGKKLLPSVTVGSSEKNYLFNEDRNKDESIESYLKPLHGLAKFASMQPLKPVYSFSMIYIPKVVRTEEEVVNSAKDHCEKLIKAITQNL